MRNHRVSGTRRQRGIALLATLTILTLWGLYLFVGQLDPTQFQMARAQSTDAALAEAKAALIGRAATDDNRPGSLPCPALDESGISPLLIGNHCPAYVGRLPWKTLRLGDLRDSAGECLWYAVAPALRDDNSAQPINAGKATELTIDGTVNIAAIVFAPGAPVANQNGRPSNSVADYLDGSNSDGDLGFVSGPPSPGFNDRTLAISRDELFRTVNQRVLREVRGPDDNSAGPPSYGLRHYHATHATFPWADSGSDGLGDAGTTAGKLPYNELGLPIWLNDNGWPPLITYQRLGLGSARLGMAGSSKTMDIVP